MQDRALSGAMTPTQRESALWFVAQHKLSLARRALASGDRVQGLKWLVKGRHAASGKRWWLTAAMTCFFSKGMVVSWEGWRTDRKLLHSGIRNASQ